MPRQPHVAGLSGEKRVVVVESGGSSFTLVLASIDEVVVGDGGRTADTRVVSKFSKGEQKLAGRQLWAISGLSRDMRWWTGRKSADGSRWK